MVFPDLQKHGLKNHFFDPKKDNRFQLTTAKEKPRQLPYNSPMTVAELRTKHPRFVYRKASWKHEDQALTIEFDFLLEPDIAFHPTLMISNVDSTALQRVSSSTMDAWVFHFGLIELFSYWKVAAPGEIVVEAGYLSPQQCAWWRELLIKSMGEFFYTNDIDFTQPDFVKFVCTVDQPAALERPAIEFPKPFLVPLGGGKDSALVLELLEENSLEYDILLSFPQSPAAKKIADLSRAQNIIELKRTIDPQLLALNRAGYLNGHTPFSARLAFESSFTGLLLGHQHILVANEYSANEGNVPFRGTTVNHQYSKTFEFENTFRQYVKHSLSPAPEYFSLLRPILELQIAGLFAKYQRYHSVFKSCNRNQQAETWCCDCAKCLFVFTVLSPFLTDKELVGPIFPHNLFEKASLTPLALALLGKDKHKPFECVGTYEETLAAFFLSTEKFRREHPGQPLPAVLEFVDREVLQHETNLPQRARAALEFWNSEHFLPPHLEKIVHSAKERLAV